MILLRVLLLFAVGIPVFAQSLESWNSVDNVFPLGGAALTLHGQWRLENRFRRFYQYRFGSIVRVPVSRVSIGGGYYFQEGRAVTPDWHRSGRLFAFVEIPINERANSFSTRAQLERFHGFTVTGPTRYRQYLRYERTTGHWRPNSSIEVFFDHRGNSGFRPAVGLARQLSRNAQFEVGYYYDARRRRAGPDRQALYTRFRFSWP